jgi:hypothetical protein
MCAVEYSAGPKLEDRGEDVCVAFISRVLKAKVIAYKQVQISRAVVLYG